MKLCVQCGGDIVRGTTELDLRRVEDHRFIVTVPAWCCKKCGEAYIDGPLLERLELEIARRVLEAGAHSGAAFRFIRKTLGLSATSVAELLNVAPETISRWENGKREIDRAAFATLGALVNDALANRTDTLDLLRAMRRPQHSDEPVRFDLSKALATA
jgi:putative zinc finger/helix-turn-helix YgiT family protein